MIKVLLIWEEVPENIKIYDLQVDEITYEKLAKCHGLYINGGLEDYELAEWLSNYMMHKVPIYIGNENKNPPFDSIEKSKIIVTGFIM